MEKVKYIYIAVRGVILEMQTWVLPGRHHEIWKVFVLNSVTVNLKAR